MFSSERWQGVITKPARKGAILHKKNLEQRVALEEAYRVRTCPPRHILYRDPPDEALSRHLASCSFCRDDRAALATLMAGRPSLAGMPPQPDQPKADAAPAVGDLRRIQETLGRWGPRGRYFNPPLVLLVDGVKGRKDVFRAAQIHDFPALKGPGDTALFAEVFAESWNIYPVTRGCLGPLVRRVDKAAVARVLKNVWRCAQEEERAAPAGLFDKILRPPAYSETSFREAFRRLEKETAAFFASSMLRDLSKPFAESRLRRALRETCTDLGALEDAFGTAILIEDNPAEDPLRRLVLSSWMPPALPMAAAGRPQGFFLKRIQLSPSPAVDPVWAELRAFEETQDGFLVAGKIQEPLSEETEIHAVWRIPGGRALAWEAQLDPKTGYFRLLFPEVSKRTALLANLEVLIGRP